MRLFCVSDLHGDLTTARRILDRAANADVILLGGDLTNFGTPREAETLVCLAQEVCPTVFAVAGNCDSREIDARLADLGVGLMARGMTYNGVGFYGLSAMPPWQNWMYHLTEEEISQSLAAGRDQLEDASCEVLLSHPPPHGCALDKTSRGQHVGSTSLHAWIEQTQPTLVVCGHIHEGRGVDRIGPTTIVNCGPCYLGSYATIDLTEETVEVKMGET